MSGPLVKGQALFRRTSSEFEWVYGTLLGNASDQISWVQPPTGDMRAVHTATLVHLEAEEAKPKEPETVRARVLDEAKRITATDRNTAYGEPEDNFQRIADYWSVWLGERLKDGEKITPRDTAAMMIMVKLAREMNAPKEDNKTDGAGYFACWAEVDARE